MTSLLPVFPMMNSHRRHPFVLWRAMCDLQPIRLGEEKLSPELSSIARAAGARWIPMPWNWIFPPTLHIPLDLNRKMAGCRPRRNAFMRL